MNKIIEKLRDDEHYYGDFGRKYISNSDIDKLINDPKSFRKPSFKTTPMLYGGYFHTAILEPEKIGNYKVVDASTRNTKIYKDACNGGEMLLLSKEVEEIRKMVGTIEGVFGEMIHAEGNVFELPAIGQPIEGEVMFKGKADIVSDEFVLDLKTTGDIRKFKYSARTYNYDSQAYIYEKLFGKRMRFLVIDKSTLNLGLFDVSDEFLDGGRAKVCQAIEQYNKFFGENPTDSVRNYYINGLL